VPEPSVPPETADDSPQPEAVDAENHPITAPPTAMSESPRFHVYPDHFDPARFPRVAPPRLSALWQRAVTLRPLGNLVVDEFTSVRDQLVFDRRQCARGHRFPEGTQLNAALDHVDRRRLLVSWHGRRHHMWISRRITILRHSDCLRNCFRHFWRRKGSFISDMRTSWMAIRLNGMDREYNACTTEDRSNSENFGMTSRNYFVALLV
jgi:hypothetical protein